VGDSSLILLTGTSGFIGSHLLRSLIDKQLHVYTYSRIDGLKGVRLPENISSKIEILILCGGYVQHNTTEGNSQEQSRISWQVLNQILEHDFKNLKKIIFLSTTDVYRSGINITESSAIMGSNQYTETKLEQEEFLREFGKRRGVDLQILRVGNIYGPGAWRFNKFLPRLISQSVQGLEFELFVSGCRTMQHLYVKDLVQFIIYAIFNDASSEVLNITGLTKNTVDELIEIVAANGSIRILRHQESSHFTQKTFEVNPILTQVITKPTPIELGIKETWREFIEHYNC